MIVERLNNIFLRAEVVDTTLLRNNPLRSHKQLEGISRKQSNLHVSNVILKFELGGDAGASNAIGKSYECRSSRHYGCKEEDGAACVTMHGGCFCFVLEEPAVLVLRRVVAQSHLSSPKHIGIGKGCQLISLLRESAVSLHQPDIWGLTKGML